MQIAEYLRWDSSSYELKKMARAFAIVDGMKDAILRKLPRVLIHVTVDAEGVLLGSRRCAEWDAIFSHLSTAQKEIMGYGPRLCRYDDSDAISRITPDEEVHLLLPSERHAANVSTCLFQRRIGRFHVHLALPSNMTPDLRNFLDSFLNPKLLPRISSLTITGDGWDKGSSTFGIREHLTPTDTPVFERASIPLKVLDMLNFLIPQQLKDLEINVSYYQ